MRAGELKHLTWDDVDFERGVLHIRPKDDWQPKTGDIRAVPISPALRELLGQLPRRTRWVVTARASRRYPDGDHQISERRLLDYLKRVLKRLGLKGHLHTFRHAFISHALTSGVPPIAPSAETASLRTSQSVSFRQVASDSTAGSGCPIFTNA
jgi:integrase/recombinase XerD